MNKSQDAVLNKYMYYINQDVFSDISLKILLAWIIFFSSLKIVFTFVSIYIWYICIVHDGKG